MTTTTTKVADKNLNFPLLTEELVASIVPAYGLLLAGFSSADGVLYVPNATRQVISTRDTPGGKVVDAADPGELRFETRNALTAAQDTALDGVLTAHNATTRTAEQTRQAQDATDAAQLVTDYGAWDGMTAEQRDATTKIMLRLVARDWLGQDAEI